MPDLSLSAFTITPLQQMAALAKETFDAFMGAGFTEEQARKMTVDLLKRGES